MGVQYESMQLLQPIGEEPVRQVDGNPAATHIPHRTQQVIGDLNRVKPCDKLRPPLIGYWAGRIEGSYGALELWLCLIRVK